MSEDIAIRVDNVNKSFKLPHEKRGSVKNVFLNIFSGRTTYEKQDVLKNISFEIKKGEFFGIVGRNGSGKSTLLKLISGIYSPDKGHIKVNGKLVPFIELGVGFSPELTGRENVFLNGALLGFDRKQMTEMYDEIVEFAELEKFMDQTLKNYSSGMQVRLAFSIAIRANTDILVLDEVLAVGDEAFQRKCFEYFEKIKSDRKTIILVTHDMSMAEKFCDRAILLSDGKLVLDSTPAKVASRYREIISEKQETKLLARNNTKTINQKDKEVFIKSLKVVSEEGEKRAILKPQERIRVFCDIQSNINVGKVAITIRCDQPNGTKILFAVSSKSKKLTVNLSKGEVKTLCWEVEGVLNDGSYVLGASIFSEDLKHNYDEALDIYRFEVRGSKWPHSVIWPKDKLYFKGPNNEKS